MQARPACSVVVMGYRDAATIERAVRSVVDQRCDDAFEVLVVISGDDESEGVVRRSFPELELISSPTRLLPGGARNAGVAAASGEVIAFLAADCVAEPGWIGARLAAHRRGWDAVASAITNGEPRSLPAWACCFDLYSARLPGRPAGPVGFPDPACHGLSYTRLALERLGPFAEEARIGEDTDMARRMAAAGVAAWFEPAVRTATFGPTSTVALVRDRARRGAQVVLADQTAPPPTLRSVPGRWARRVRTTMAAAWRDGGPDRARVVASSPWVVLGAAAGLVGAWRAGSQRRKGREVRRSAGPRRPSS